MQAEDAIKYLLFNSACVTWGIPGPNHPGAAHVAASNAYIWQLPGVALQWQQTCPNIVTNYQHTVTVYCSHLSHGIVRKKNGISDNWGLLAAGLMSGTLAVAATPAAAIASLEHIGPMTATAAAITGQDNAQLQHIAKRNKAF